MTNRTFIHVLVATASVLVLSIAGAACRQQNPMATAASVPGFLDVALPPHPPATAATLARGKELYDVNCAHCHGEKGDGAGYGAPFLVPPPRDFVAAQ
jgi:mono/diheme cytochrome c family protein